MSVTSTQPNPSTLPPPLTLAHEHILPLLRTYLSLHLRANQKLAILHRRLQHNRYENIVHGPPYDRLEHWLRLLNAAQREYDAVQIEWRERGDGLDRGFEERVRKGIGALEIVLEEVRIEEEGEGED
jgi:hypothetical protein